MFGNQSKPSRIYSYGAREPREGLAPCLEQMRRMHDYRNQLVRAELDRRQAVEDVLNRLRPDVSRLRQEVADAEAALETARAEESRRKQRHGAHREAIRRLQVQVRVSSDPQEKARLRREIADRKAARQDDADPASAREQIAALREQRNGLYCSLRESRREAFAAEDVQAALAEVEECHRDRQRRLRAASGLYWGNYLSVEAAAGSFRSGAPPVYQRWDGQFDLDTQAANEPAMQQWRASGHTGPRPELPDARGLPGDGRICVQLQKGLSVQDAMLGNDNRIRIELTRTTGHGGRQVGNAWVRVGSSGQGGRQPVWCVVPFTYHRPLPPDALIKWVYLQRTREGRRYRWQVQFVIAREAGWDIPDAAETGTVAVNLGWRTTEDGLLTATWVGDDGRQGTLVLPTGEVEHRWRKPEELQSLRDEGFNAARDHLAAWLDSQGDGTHLPAWLASVRPHLRQWRSSARLRALVLHWHDHRFTGDDDIFPRLWGRRIVQADGKPGYDWWYLQEVHLLDWQQSVMASRTRWRDDIYRNFAVSLRRQYHKIRLAKIRWSDMAASQPVECEEAENAVARYNQRVAAPYRLQQLLIEAFAESELIPAKNLTQTCSECGRLDAFDAATEVVRSCQHCGTPLNQDVRHCRNLLAAPAPTEEPASGEVAV